MSQSSLIIFGAGGHARACIDVIEKNQNFKIAGLIGMPNEIGTMHLGYRVIASDSDLPVLATEFKHAFVAVGQIKSSLHRVSLFSKIKKAGLETPSIISPLAYVSPRAKIGSGTIVMHGAIVNAGSIVGKGCIINSCALIEHDVYVSHYCHISTGVILNGAVKIGRRTFIGSGSIVKEGIVIGNNCVVGMGQKVGFNLDDNNLIC